MISKYNNNRDVLLQGFRFEILSQENEDVVKIVEWKLEENDYKTNVNFVEVPKKLDV